MRSVPTHTVPNRLYELAATSFGHLVTSINEIPLPPSGGFQPINGTIFDLLDKNNVTWGEYVDVSGVTELGIPYGGLVHNPVPPHFQTLDDFMSQASSGNWPSVAYVDFSLQDSEHPPYDIRAGESLMASVINAVRSGPNWKDSIIIWTYDEHGGFYDHVTRLPRSRRTAFHQENARTGPTRPRPRLQVTVRNAPTARRRSRCFARRFCPAKPVSTASISTVSVCRLWLYRHSRNRLTSRIRLATTRRFSRLSRNGLRRMSI
jgi:phospholipase C